MVDGQSTQNQGYQGINPRISGLLSIYFLDCQGPNIRVIGPPMGFIFLVNGGLLSGLQALLSGQFAPDIHRFAGQIAHLKPRFEGPHFPIV